MANFFCGWRRKIGVVTLLMACGFAGAWVRSLSIEDIIVFNSGKHMVEMLIFSGGGLVWSRVQDKDLITLTLPRPFHQTYPAGIDPFKRTVEISINGVVVERTTLEPDIKWQMRWCGFGIGEKDSPSIRFVEIPYGSLVIPLTLISAYLLLVKPRAKSSPTKST